MFWKPTMLSLPIVNKRNALDVNLSPAHPKKIRKDVEKSFVSRKDCETQTEPLKKILTTKAVKKFRDGNVDTKIVSKKNLCLICKLFDMHFDGLRKISVSAAKIRKFVV